MLDIESLSFSFGEKRLFNNFNLKIVGSKRIAIIGQNGSGKTTLFKLITGALQPKSGEITLGVGKVAYLDQQAAQLSHDRTVLENFALFNPEVIPAKRHLYLAQFLFCNETVHKIVKDLSGGEKLRLLLACLLFAKHPPQLLLLDEPTNHLDLESVELMEQALRDFRGAMLVISHDQQFLENINADCEVCKLGI